MAAPTSETNSFITSRLAIIVSVVALIISILALQKSSIPPSQDLVNSIRNNQETNPTPLMTSDSDLNDIVTPLEQIRMDLSLKKDYEEAQKNIMEVRQDINTRFITAGSDSQIYLQSINDQLAIIESQLRENAASALDSLDVLIEKIKTDIRKNTQ